MVDPTLLENLPASQFSQSEGVVDPTVVENFPASQLKQDVRPSRSLNVPGWQLVQEAAPAKLYRPNAQNWQTETETAASPNVLYRPAVQSVQAEIEVDAVRSLKVPGTQEVQESDRVVPTHLPWGQPEQTDADVAAAPDVLNRPATQSTHASIEVEAVFSLYCPAAQEVQEVDLVVPTHLPCSHSRQDVAPSFAFA